MDLWMLPSLKLLAKSERYSDCKFIVEDVLGQKIFSCHKLILSCASEVFERMLYGGQCEESKIVEVTLNDVDRDVFEKFRNYIYGFQKKELNDYSNDTLLKLIYFGNKYLITSIITDCIQTLTTRSATMDITELLQLFQCAYEISDKAFIATVSIYIKRSNSLTHNSIYELSPNVFYQYIILTKNLLAESIRFTLIEVYLKMHDCTDAINDIAQLHQESDDCEALSETHIGQELANDEKTKKEPSTSFETDIFWPNYMKNLVDLVDLKKLTTKEFYDGPGKSSLLTFEQKYEFLYKIINLNEYKIPEQMNQVGDHSHNWKGYRNLDARFDHAFGYEWDCQ